jgi:formylglycine-generating enzyme required for sulfatase activity
MVGPVNPKELINFVGMRFVRMPGHDHYIGKYTVTQKEWVAVLGTKPWKGKSYAKEGDDHPATYISWNDCQELVDKLNSR